MNKENWKYLSIGDCATVVGGGTPSTKNPEYWDGDIPWISPKDLSNNTNKYVSRGERFITKKGLENSSAKILPENSLLFSSRAPIGYLAINTQPMATNQGFKSLILKDEFDVEFFYYLFKQKTEYIKNFSYGSTFQEIPGSEVKNLKFLIPPYKEQKQISKILSKLDKKIELNRKMNNTLEEISKTLFKSWFIDFDPVKARLEGRPTGLSKEISDLFPDSFEDSELGKIPKGWKISSLEHFCESVRDGTHDSPKSSEDGEYLITTRNIVNGEIDLSNAYKISKEDYEDVNRRSKVDKWDVLISMIGTVGEVCLVREEPKFAIKNLGLFKNRSRLHGEWLYYFLKSTYAQTHLRSNLRGTTQLYIPLGELRDFPFFCPPEDILSSFGELTSVLTDKIGHNLNENQTLSELREILLPKLISGELKIPDVESLIEEASI